MPLDYRFGVLADPEINSAAICKRKVRYISVRKKDNRFLLSTISREEIRENMELKLYHNKKHKIDMAVELVINIKKSY